MSIFEVSKKWKAAFPGAHAGVLLMRNVSNPENHAGLDREKLILEKQLRNELASRSREEMEALPVQKIYDEYYKRFKKTYHVQLQLESIVHKGKSIPSNAALVEVMFMAEVKNMLLTAGHDADRLRLPVVLDVADGTEMYTLLRGQSQQTKAGDMMMVDGEGIISSIIYGPNQHTQITPATKNVIFTVYAPTGISQESVHAHLGDLEYYARLIAPEAQVELSEVFTGN